MNPPPRTLRRLGGGKRSIIFKKRTENFENIHEKLIEIFCYFLLKTHFSLFWIENVNGTNVGGGRAMRKMVFPLEKRGSELFKICQESMKVL